MDSLPKLLIFFIICCNVKTNMAEKNKFITMLSERFQDKLSECTNYAANWLEDFNDRHLGNSELGKMLHYKELKSKFHVESSTKGRGIKKMGMALIPLIFHVGATSTWMLLTTLMTAKSVAIGMALLIFKIAVSSAKVASFFTLWKAKTHHHHDYSWSPPHHDHHGYRSLPAYDSYHPSDWKSYSPEVHDASPPAYKHHEPPYEDIEYNEEKKPHIIHS